MPRPAIGIRPRVRGVGQRTVCESPFSLRGGLIDGRPNEWMAEGPPLANLEQAGLLRRIGRLDAEAELRRGAEQEQWIAERLGRCEHEQPAGLLGQRLQPPPEAVLDPAGE